MFINTAIRNPYYDDVVVPTDSATVHGYFIIIIIH